MIEVEKWKGLAHSPGLLKSVKALVLDDHFYAKSILSEMVKRFGIRDVDSMKNSNMLFYRGKLKYDFFFAGFDLNDSKSGIDVVKSLLDANVVKKDCVIVFVTRFTDDLNAVLFNGFNPIITIPKPYSEKCIKEAIHKGMEMRSLISPLIPLVEQQKYNEAIDKLNHIAHKKNLNKDLSGYQRQLKAQLYINAHQLEALTVLCNNNRKETWAIWSNIERLYLEKQYPDCIAILEKLITIKRYRYRAAVWLSKLYVLTDELEKAFDAYSMVPDSSMSITDIRLKGYLLLLIKGESEAFEYLTKRKNRAFEYRMFQIDLVISKARLHLILAHGKKTKEERAPVLAQLKEVLDDVKWGNQITLHKIQARLLYNTAKAMMKEHEMPKLRRDFEEIEANSDNMDIIGLCVVIYQLRITGQFKECKEYIFKVNQRLYDMPESSERVLATLIYHRLLNTIFKDEDIAVIYNSLGLAAFKESSPKLAIRFFFKASEKNPTEVLFLLNLLRSMVDMEVETYQTIEIDMLIRVIGKAELNEKEKSYFDGLVKKRKGIKPKVVAVDAKQLLAD